MFRMNKKGIMPTLVLVFTLLCLGAFLFFSSEAAENQKGVIGASTVELINLDFQSKADAIYDEQIIKQNFANDFVTLMENGAYYKQSKTSDGYVYWKRDNINCFPNVELVNSNLIKSINSSLKASYDFDLNFDRTKIILNLQNNKQYTSKQDNYEIKMKPKNGFSISYDYDIDSVMNNVWKVERIVNLCGDDRNCWSDNADFVWKNEDKLYKVELPSDKIVDAFGEKEVILKAAIDFEELNPLVGEVFECSV
nr:hypothetical protein [Nanoarchaeum sp.]